MARGGKSRQSKNCAHTLLQMLTSESGTDLPTSAPQRFRPLLEDQLTVSGSPREDRP
jgi:hypothetical protein